MTSVRDCKKGRIIYIYIKGSSAIAPQGIIINWKTSVFFQVSMAEYLAALPICILRVDLQCSNCSTKVKNKLLKINGVSSVDMNKKEGLVLVSGNVDPPTLQKALTKMGKNAQVWVYEKDPTKARNKLDQFIWSMQKEHDNHGQDNCCTKESMNFNKHKPDQEHDYRATLMPSSYCGMGYNNIAPAASFDQYGQRWVSPRYYSAGYQGLPPTNATEMVPYNYMERPYGYGYPGYQSSIYGGSPQQPMPPPLRLPLLQMPLSNVYDAYSGQTGQPSGNSIFHSFSDDNVRACTIM